MISTPSSLENPTPSAPRQTLRILVLGNLVIAVVLALAALFWLQQSRQAYADKALSEAQNIAQTLQKTLAADLSRISLGLANVVLQYEKNTGATGAQTDALLHDQKSLQPDILDLRMADALGWVRHGDGVDPAHPVNVSDRDFFSQARQSPAGDSVLSGPVLARISKQWVLVMARRLHKRDGSFAGVVYANLPVSNFQQQIEALKLGQQGAVTLRMSSLSLVARQTTGQNGPLDIGSTKVSAELAQALQAHPSNGHFTSVTALDGVTRISVYQKVESYPLLVLVGLGHEDAMRPWWTDVQHMLATLCLAILLMAGASALAYQSWSSESAAVRERGLDATRYKALLLVSNDGMHVLDRSGNLVEMSDSFAKLLGYAPDELQGQNLALWVAHRSAQESLAWIQQFELGQIARHETVFRRADGSLVPVDICAMVQRVHGVDLVYISTHDNSAHKRHEADIMASAAQVRDLWDNAPCGYHSLDSQGRFVHINATELAWLGCTAEEVIGKRMFTDFMTHESARRFREVYSKFMHTGHVEDVEYNLMARDGSVRRVLVNSTAIFDSDGTYARSRAVLTDITEQTRAQLQRQQLAAEQAAILDNDVVGIVKFRGRVAVWVNRGLEKMLAYSREDVVGKTSQVFYANDENHAAFAPTAFSALRNYGQYRGQGRMLRKDGSPLWVHVSGTRLANNHEESVWLFVNLSNGDAPDSIPGHFQA